MICVSLLPNSIDELRSQLTTAAPLADVVEIRVDSLPDSDWDALTQIVAQCELPLLLTLRSAEQGGHWVGGQSERDRHIRRLAKMQPDYLDVEFGRDEAVLAYLRTNATSPKLLLSYHNFMPGPHNLPGIWRTMKNIEADLYKISVGCQSTLEALGILRFSRDAGDQMIAIGMGERGQVTRILGPLVGNPWTYAALDDDKATGPGQLTAGELRQTYHYHKLGKRTVPYALIGNPVAQSIGHIAHNKVYEALNLNAVYVKLCLEEREVVPAIGLCRQLGFEGFSVTIPYKEQAAHLCDRVAGKASQIGAVNTLSYTDGTSVGSNTDAAAALDAIEAQELVKGKQLLLLGAGGSARAVAFEAVARGAQVTVASRTLSRAQKLARDLNARAVTLDDLPDAYDILVNATPDQMPISKESLLPDSLVMDLKVYSTDLLRHAEKSGCRIVSGLEMFVRQGAEQIITWFPQLHDKQEVEALFRQSCEGLD